VHDFPRGRRAASTLVLGNTLLRILFDPLNGDRAIGQTGTATGAQLLIHTAGALADFHPIVARCALHSLKIRVCDQFDI
jgi:hypothetical protein